jgi:p-aminobenzoyl-glutamate transporter AbgT
MDSSKITSLIQGASASLLTALVTFKVLDASKASVVGGVVVSLAPLAAALYIHSIRKPKP